MITTEQLIASMEAGRLAGKTVKGITFDDRNYTLDSGNVVYYYDGVFNGLMLAGAMRYTYSASRHKHKIGVRSVFVGQQEKEYVLYESIIFNSDNIVGAIEELFTKVYEYVYFRK